MNAELLHGKVAAAAALVEQNELARAESLARDVLAVNSRHAGALHVLGVVARKTKRYELATQSLRTAAREGNHPAMYFELAASLAEARRPLEALEAFQAAARLDPRFPEAALNIGALLDRLDRHAEALPWCRQAVELNPQCSVARMNLGNVLRAVGRLDEAICELEAAVALAPSVSRLHWNLSLAYLLAGRLAEGWQEYEWREESGEVVLDRYPQPRWTGQPLAGKSIVVHGEQGIGDEILFATCLPDIVRQAKRCVLVCDPRLAPLLARSFPEVAVVGAARRIDRAPAPLPIEVDYQIPAGSLPGHFRKSPPDFPRQRRFLTPDSAALEMWRKRLNELGPGLKVGISWRAGGQPVSRRKRSTDLAQWRELFAVPGVSFVNLQYGECAKDLATAREKLGATIHDWAEADPLVDLDAFAAKVAALDLVVSVGNATVHLAGALGTPAWALVPLVPGWRWLMSGETNPWYESVQLFRQAQLDCWEGVFRQTADMLRQLAGANESRHEARIFVPADVNQPLAAVAAPPIAALERLSDTRAAIAAAARAYESGDMVRAETLCNEVIEHAPRNHVALHILGLVAHRTGRVDLAIRLLSRAASAHQGDAVLVANLASALDDGGRLDEAIEQYRTALALKPNLADVQLRLGTALFRAGRAAEAVEPLECYARSEPSAPKGHNTLGSALLAAGRAAEAVAPLRQAIRLRPEYMAAHNNLGQAMQVLGNWEEAAACYQRALALEADCVEALVNLGDVMLELHQPQTAARLLRRAVDRSPEHVPALKRLGMALAQQEDYDGALGCYERALAVQPGLPGVTMHRDAARRMAAARGAIVPATT